MSMPTSPRRRWYQFGLRSMLVALTTTALLIWGAREFHEWNFSLPLSQAIASYNSAHRVDGQPELTDNEVIASIESQLPDLAASPQVKAIYANILRTRRLPRTAESVSYTHLTLPTKRIV